MKDIEYEVLVLGLGSVLMSDDGLGVRVVEELVRKEWPPGVSLLEVGTSVMYYLEEISRSRHIVVVDAVRGGGEPGSVYRLQAEDVAHLPDDRRNSHGISLLDVIELARGLTGFPADIVIYGVEPMDLGPGNKLSSAVHKVLPALINKLSEEIQKLASHNHSSIK